MSEHNSQLLVLNSLDRSNGESHSFILQLPRSYNNIIAIELQSVSMPTSFYNIKSGFNNTIVFNDGTDRTVTLNPGNYSASAIATEIQTKLNASASSLTFTVSFSSNTMKMTIAADGAFVLKFTNSQSCWRELGFTNTDTSSATSHTGTNVISLDRPHHIYIHVAELDSRIETSSSSFFPHFVLNINSNAGDLSFYHSLSSFSQTIYMNRTSLHNLNITLTDEDGNDIDLNGSEWSMIWRLHFKQN